jgi:hypothetical protein
MYVVVNSTSGGFQVVIRGTGPTAGVLVAAGSTALVVWNGTDFVVATTTVNGGIF